MMYIKRLFVPQMTIFFTLCAWNACAPRIACTFPLQNPEPKNSTFKHICICIRRRGAAYGAYFAIRTLIVLQALLYAIHIYTESNHMFAVLTKSMYIYENTEKKQRTYTAFRNVYIVRHSGSSSNITETSYSSRFRKLRRWITMEIECNSIAVGINFLPFVNGREWILNETLKSWVGYSWIINTFLSFTQLLRKSEVEII